MAVVLFVGLAVGALASFTDALGSLAGLFREQPRDAPLVSHFQTTPQQIELGGKATLEWRVAKADSVTIDTGVGAVPLTGTLDVSPAQTVTFTLSATGPGGRISSTTTLRVAAPTLPDGTLVLSDVFVGDAGWHLPTDNAFRSSVAGGRFHMELTTNHSGQCVTRELSIGQNEDFIIQVAAQSTAPTEYALGLCWTVTGGATYMFYVTPSLTHANYQLYRDEVYQQAGSDGQLHPYQRSVNVLTPDDLNRRQFSSSIRTGTDQNLLSIARRGRSIQLFLNGQYLNQGAYQSAAVERVGMFISGELAADFSEFTVRVLR